MHLLGKEVITLRQSCKLLLRHVLSSLRDSDQVALNNRFLLSDGQLLGLECQLVLNGISDEILFPQFVDARLAQLLRHFVPEIGLLLGFHLFVD